MVHTSFVFLNCWSKIEFRCGRTVFCQSDRAMGMDFILNKEGENGGDYKYREENLSTMESQGWYSFQSYSFRM
jgi:hypothetical protein